MPTKKKAAKHAAKKQPQRRSTAMTDEQQNFQEEEEAELESGGPHPGMEPETDNPDELEPQAPDSIEEVWTHVQAILEALKRHGIHVEMAKAETNSTATK